MMRSSNFLFLLALVTALLQPGFQSLTGVVEAFQQPKSASDGNSTPDRLMKQFATSFGEVVNPYQILQVPRDAERSTIKESYRRMMKKFHPDARINKDILPGKWCVQFTECQTLVFS